MSFSSGDIVAGTYRVDKLIARGGMGEVYAVEHLSMKRALALKTIHPNRITQGAWQAFMREGKVLSRLEHPNLVRVYDLGVFENRTPYFVMDLLDGESLASFLKREGPLHFRQAMPIFEQIASGLAYAQALSLVHRDIKPGNIMLIKNRERELTVKIVDLGLATEVNDTQTSGKIYGSPLYMSPEQGLAQPLDSRSDMYSLGCTLFEALTGTTPFIGENAIVTLSKHQTEKPPTLKEASLGGDFPEELELLLARMLAKDPSARFQSFDDLAKIFHKLIDADLSKLKRTRPADEKQTASALDDDQSETNETRKAEKKLPILIAAGSLLIAFALAGAYFLSPGKRPGQPSMPPRQELANTPDVVSNDVTAARILEQYENKSFSHIAERNGKKMRIFNFPENVSLGKIRLVSDRSEGSEAQGTVSFALEAPLYYGANQLPLEKPALLRKFSNGDLVFLALSKSVIMPDDSLIYIDHLTDLEGLSLSGSTFGDPCLKYLDKFTRLKFLDIRGTEITPGGLQKSKIFKKIENLQVDANATGKFVDLIYVLKTAPALKTLTIDKVIFSDQDFKALCQCKDLKSLTLMDIKFNPAVVGELGKMSALQSLVIVESDVPQSILPVLKTMPNLKELRLGLSGWSLAERNALSEAMKAKNTKLVIDDRRKHQSVLDRFL